MKVFSTIITFFLLLNYSFSQTEIFRLQWTLVENEIKQIDSSCNYVKTKKESFKRKFSKITYYSLKNKRYKHIMRVDFKSGNTFIKHKYKLGSDVTINVLEINGQRVLIRSNFYIPETEKNSKNTFINTGNNLWRWSYKYDGDSVKKHKTEVIYNWH